MQDDAADELYIEMAHTDSSFAGLSYEGKCLRQQLIQGFTVGESFPEFGSFLRECRVGQLRKFLFIAVDDGNGPAHMTQDAIIPAAKQLGDHISNHCRNKKISGLVQK